MRSPQRGANGGDNAWLQHWSDVLYPHPKSSSNLRPWAALLHGADKNGSVQLTLAVR